MTTPKEYIELVVWQDQASKDRAHEAMDKLIGFGWSVFATHTAVSDESIAVVYILEHDGTHGE